MRGPAWNWLMIVTIYLVLRSQVGSTIDPVELIGQVKKDTFPTQGINRLSCRPCKKKNCPKIKKEECPWGFVKDGGCNYCCNECAKGPGERCGERYIGDWYGAGTCGKGMECIDQLEGTKHTSHQTHEMWQGSTSSFLYDYEESQKIYGICIPENYCSCGLSWKKTIPKN